MKTLKIEIDCEEKTCGECRWFNWISEPECKLFLEYGYCVPLEEFGSTPENNDKRFTRHPACLASEDNDE